MAPNEATRGVESAESTQVADSVTDEVPQRTVGWDPGRPFNSVEDTATYAGVSRALGYQLARSGEWPSVRMGRRLMIVTARWSEKYCLD